MSGSLSCGVGDAVLDRSQCHVAGPVATKSFFVALICDVPRCGRSDSIQPSAGNIQTPLIAASSFRRAYMVFDAPDPVKANKRPSSCACPRVSTANRATIPKSSCLTSHTPGRIKRFLSKQPARVLDAFSSYTPSSPFSNTAPRMISFLDMTPTNILGVVGH
ncbi:hypothetical protein VDGL01_04554 [Verticillium dahliae]